MSQCRYHPSFAMKSPNAFEDLGTCSNRALYDRFPTPGSSSNRIWPWSTRGRARVVRSISLQSSTSTIPIIPT